MVQRVMALIEALAASFQQLLLIAVWNQEDQWWGFVNNIHDHKQQL